MKPTSPTAPLKERTWIRVTLLTLAVGAVFALTAEWNDQAVNVDAVAANLPAWSLTQHGTLDLTGVDVSNPWLIETPSGTYSNRPPGLWAMAIPAYLAMGDPDEFSTDPGTLTAVVIAAAAIGLLFSVLRTTVGSASALASVLVVAFGTALWPIASTQLWPHGPGALVAASALLAMAAGRYLLAASALGIGILVRPPTAVFPATIGWGAVLSRWGNAGRVLASFALPASVAVLVLLAYNHSVFGEVSLSGGYPSAFTENLASMGVVEYLGNLAKMFVLPPNGLIYWSPVIAIAVVAAIQHRRSAPSWSRWAAVAAVLYLLVHARMNRASGGLPFNYRYPIEPLVLAAPFLATGAIKWFKAGGWRRSLTLTTAVLSVGLQTAFIMLLTCVPSTTSEVVCSFGAP